MTLNEQAVFAENFRQQVQAAISEYRDNLLLDDELNAVLAPIEKELVSVYGKGGARANVALLRARAIMAAQAWTEAGRDITPAQWLRDVAKLRVEASAQEQGEPGDLQQAAMYRSKAETAQEFVDGIPDSGQVDKSFFHLREIAREDETLSNTPVELGTDQVRHIRRRHPEFTEWDRIPDAIEGGHAVAIGKSRYTQAPAFAYILDEGDTSLVVLGSPVAGNQKRNRPGRVVTLTSFRGDTAAINGWAAKYENAASPSGQNQTPSGARGLRASLPSEDAPLSPQSGVSEQIIKSLNAEVNEIVESGESKTFFQSAYQGSPTRGITRMSTDFIGTGEDTLNEGWGLYASEKKEIADWYRKVLSSSVSLRRGNVVYKPKGWSEWIRSDGAELSDIEKRALRQFELLQDKEGVLRAAERRGDQEMIDFFRDAEERHEGQVYQLDIPDNDVLLKRESDLSEQPDKVKDALRKGAESMPDDDAEASMAEALAGIMENDGNGVTGSQLYDLLARLGTTDFDETLTISAEGKKAASLFLNKLGIPGLRYLSGEDENAHNYVIWDDSAIDILNTYYQSAGRDPQYAEQQAKFKA
ncbi:MAG: hypothetical protein LBM64_06640, partial [Deltaproteobacteria bacterium]|nr:hypothetical protein [Deltaproteobacteria bacterium]